MMMQHHIRPTGILTFLACLLLASGLIRGGTGISLAQARQAELPDTQPMDCPAPPQAVIDTLKRREERISLREDALARSQAALEMSAGVLDRRMTELQDAEERLSLTMSRAAGAAEEDLARLTLVYEAMRPQEAARLFDKMDSQFAAGFLSRMQPASAGAIMAGMSNESAYAASVLLASRNAAAPRQ